MLPVQPQQPFFAYPLLDNLLHRLLSACRSPPPRPPLRQSPGKEPAFLPFCRKIEIVTFSLAS
ncbi:MAG: hypothetical protein EBS01_15850 [Verrucomicrobia bacterium]|nr:hypothetical protein [Verrucomicrobiota bacterium]